MNITVSAYDLDSPYCQQYDISSEPGSTDLAITLDLLNMTKPVLFVGDGGEDGDDADYLEGHVEVSARLVAPEYELVVEVDYISGHKPTPAVLWYIRTYYMGNNPDGSLIDLEFVVDDEISSSDLERLGIYIEDGLSIQEFWALERAFNDVLFQDDQSCDGHDADGDGYDYEFSLKEKWVLYGTACEESQYVCGYCFMPGEDAGNYIFVADATTDWAAYQMGLKAFATEAVVLMHELGHSIGIIILDAQGREVYCDDPECVMAVLSDENAGLYFTWPCAPYDGVAMRPASGPYYFAWRYCPRHWATKDLGYYRVGEMAVSTGGSAELAGGGPSALGHTAMWSAEVATSGLGLDTGLLPHLYLVVRPKELLELPPQPLSLIFSATSSS